MIAVGIFAAGDIKDGVKTKRAYSLNYAYHPITYDHDFITHAPTHVVHHEPIISHAAIAHPFLPGIHAPVAAKTSVVSTSVHHLPAASYIATHHAPIVSAAYVAHPPVVHTSPLLTEFHRR